MEFSYESYGRMIGLLRENGYQICPYQDNYEADRVCVLRHDVDSSLEKALEFAEFEHELGVCSTYFVLVRSDFYNPFSKKNASLIHRIQALGHDIGLHFDEKYLEGQDQKEISAAIASEAECMGRLLDIAVGSVSMHRPSQEALQADYRIPGLVNSYSQRFFREFKYVSDSRRNWREDVCEIIRSDEFPQLHILTHPIWYSRREQSVRETLLDFICRADEERYHALTGEFTRLEEFITEEDIGKKA